MSLEDFAIPYAPEDVEAFEAEKSTPSVVKARLADQQQATWVAEEAGELVGFVDAGPCNLPHPEVGASDLELNRLYVLRTRQGRGYGKLLMDAAIEWMSSRAPGPQWIGVWSGNLRAQRFYAAYGFRKVGEYDFPVGRWQDRDFILRRI
jgi:diamine N-acetyltransferase